MLKGIRTSHVPRGKGAVPKTLFPKGWYTIHRRSRTSAAIPTKMSLFEKNPILKMDSLEERHAKTFPVWAIIMAVRHAVVA